MAFVLCTQLHNVINYHRASEGYTPECLNRSSHDWNEIHFSRHHLSKDTVPDN